MLPIRRETFSRPVSTLGASSSTFFIVLERDLFCTGIYCLTLVCVVLCYIYVLSKLSGKPHPLESFNLVLFSKNKTLQTL